MAVASKDGSLLVALAGAPGVVLYCREQSEAEGRPPAWQLSQRARLGPMWPACAVSMSADGSALAAAALGSQLHVWDLEPGLDAPLLELQVPNPQQLNFLSSQYIWMHSRVGSIFLSSSTCETVPCQEQRLLLSATSRWYGSRLQLTMHITRCA